ncbi:guanylate cyclase [Trichonephila clavipes]|nr:guanylate cyclase [Trichonephila clavipes]
MENSKIESDVPSLMDDPVTGRTQSKVGFYKGNAVYIYHVYKKSIDLTRSLRKEMIQIREMRHENINPFIGACVDPPNICILTLFSTRGSLQGPLKSCYASGLKAEANWVLGLTFRWKPRFVLDSC